MTGGGAYFDPTPIDRGFNQTESEQARQQEQDREISQATDLSLDERLNTGSSTNREAEKLRQRDEFVRYNGEISAIMASLDNSSTVSQGAATQQFVLNRMGADAFSAAAIDAAQKAGDYGYVYQDLNQGNSPEEEPGIEMVLNEDTEPVIETSVTEEPTTSIDDTSITVTATEPEITITTESTTPTHADFAARAIFGEAMLQVGEQLMQPKSEAEMMADQQRQEEQLKAQLREQAKAAAAEQYAAARSADPSLTPGELAGREYARLLNLYGLSA